MAFLKTFSAILATPARRLAALLLLGALVLSPAVRCAYLLDDFMHASMVAGDAGLRRGPFDLYDFVNDSDRATMVDRGLLPWWSDPKLTIRFFRPLSSALRWAELRVLGSGAVLLPHLHSLAWWAVAVLAAHALFSRLLAPRPRMLATAIFALGPWHVLPIAWLANREVLLSLVFGLLALSAQLTLVRAPRARHALLATVGFSLAFAAGEYAFCLGGYVLALELVTPGTPLVRRATRLLPFSLPALAYLVVRHAFGYGTYGSSFYADPFSEPGKILALAPQRLSLLLAEGWLTLGTNAWGTTAPRALVLVLVLGLGGAVGLALRHTLAGLDGEQRRDTVFLLGGSLIALLPVLPAVPAPRLLGVSAFGMAGAVAVLVDRAWFPVELEPRRRIAELTGLVALLLGFLQLVHGPAAAYLAGEGLYASSMGYRSTIGAFGSRLASRQAEDVHILRGAGGAFFGHFALAGLGVPVHRWRILSHTSHVLMVRNDERSFELVAPVADALYPEGATNLFRDAAHPLRTGDVVEIPGLRVEILQVGPHGPTRARYTLDRPLETAGVAFADEKLRGLTIVEPPRVGFGRTYDP